MRAAHEKIAQERCERKKGERKWTNSAYALLQYECVKLCINIYSSQQTKAKIKISPVFTPNGLSSVNQRLSSIYMDKYAHMHTAATVAADLPACYWLMEAKECPSLSILCNFAKRIFIFFEHFIYILISFSTFFSLDIAPPE